MGSPNACDELSQLLESHPLVADLHAHLMGTGDIEFWRRQLLTWPDTPVGDDIIRLVPASLLSKQSTREVRLADLAANDMLLAELLQMDSPAPGNFNSSFSPKFGLRKFVAWKHPECLTALIAACAQQYRDSRVHYVEYSLGAGWFREPFLSALVDGVQEAEQGFGVLVRFLIAFNRSEISNDLHNVEYLAGLAKLGDKKLRHTVEPKHYERHLVQLQAAKTALGVCSRAKSLVVGLDLMGNEENKPYAPFLLPEFVQFASEMRERNPNFGFRLHLGEGISSNDDVGYVSLRLGEHYVETLVKAYRFPVRCGHGLGLLGLSDSAFNRWSERYPIMRASAARRVLENLQMAPVEINLTSNLYLMGSLRTGPGGDRSLRSHPMRPLIDAGFRLVLGTDDPGIFPGVSLRGEYRIARENGLLRNASEFRTLVEESARASFASTETLEDLGSIIRGLYPDCDVPRDKPKLSTLTALDEPTIDDRGYAERRAAEFQRAKDAYKSGNPWLIEDWYNKYEPP